jgi:hypothetical protein
MHPSVRFGRPRKYVREVSDGMVIERDLKVLVRGEVHVWCDISKPEGRLGSLLRLNAWTVHSLGIVLSNLAMWETYS